MLNNFLECHLIDHDKLVCEIRQITTCTICDNESISTESFVVMPIPIALSVQMSIDKFFENISLEGDSRYNCCRCNDYVIANQSNYLSKNSKYMFFQVWRFQYYEGELIKDNSDVLPSREISIEMINEEHVPTQTLRYKLCGTIHHEGGFQAGHYWCNILKDEEWYQCNDQNVRQINTSNIEKSNMYVAVYCFIQE